MSPRSARRGEPGLERGDIDEGLEGGARLPLGLHGPIELAAEEIGAPDHRLHVTGLRLDRDHRALGRLAGAGAGRRLGRTAGERLEPFAERLLGGELHRRVQGRVDIEPALEDQVRAVFRFQRLLDVVDEVLTGRPAPLRWNQTEVRLCQTLGLFVLDAAELDQAAQHDLTTALGRFGTIERRVVRRRPREARDQRGLTHASARRRPCRSTFWPPPRRRTSPDRNTPGSGTSRGCGLWSTGARAPAPARPPSACARGFCQE